MKTLLLLGFCLVSFAAIPAVAGEIDLGVKASDRGLYFTAKSGGPFTRCTVILNDGYRASLPAIDGSGTSDLWLTEFARDSLRFDPSAERIRRVHVLCAEGDALFSLR